MDSASAHPVSPPSSPGSAVARITLAHGSGGKAMADLIQGVFLAGFQHPCLAHLNDQAVVPLPEGAGQRLALTTDSYVVSPLFFAGGDIGSLAVNGTVNDLAVGGARPLYLTCGFILEEGLPLTTLRRVVDSMAMAAAIAGVDIVAGDTKVVPRGSADKLFINTTGVGLVPPGVNLSPQAIQPGDVILINGYLGDHGAAITVARADLVLESQIESDCQPLNSLVQAILVACSEVRAMRDATRGGVATVLNEFALSAGLGILLEEAWLPVRPAVRGLCELLGLDPLYLANEGKLVVVVPASQADTVLAAMVAHPAGRDSQIIGRTIPQPAGLVQLKTAFGSDRIVDRLVGDQLPRIC
ncbi:MAG: hydrogenase expression/formation protein HypE [Cyanobacteria bacterium REEB459]|nr:hydrogenase expression/formation protein HypE [Cyanobacteria bacterium REEB459]